MPQIRTDEPPYDVDGDAVDVGWENRPLEMQKRLGTRRTMGAMDNNKPGFILATASQSAKPSLVGKEAMLIGSPPASPRNSPI